MEEINYKWVCVCGHFNRMQSLNCESCGKMDTAEFPSNEQTQEIIDAINEEHYKKDAGLLVFIFLCLAAVEFLLGFIVYWLFKLNYAGKFTFLFGDIVLNFLLAYHIIKYFKSKPE